MDLIEKNIEKIKMLCIKHKVNKLFVFGSILTNRFKSNSDIDFIVDFKQVELFDYADNYFDLKESLEKIFKKNIDLLEDKAIHNPYLKKEIDSSRKLVYG